MPGYNRSKHAIPRSRKIPASPAESQWVVGFTMENMNNTPYNKPGKWHNWIHELNVNDKWFNETW
jgi:hypothetical protein